MCIVFYQHPETLEQTPTQVKLVAIKMHLLALPILCLYSVCVTSTPSNDRRIIGGEDIAIEKVPYQASMQHEGLHWCGASIIAPNFVVTAAHCTITQKAQDLSIRAGTSTRESGGQVINVKKINEHPSYKFNLGDYDISVLELVSDLELGDKVAVLALPSEGQTWPVGTEVLVSGWGLTAEGGTTYPLNLQGVIVNLVDREVCNRSYSGLITERMICAGVPEGGKDSCQEDSGGPLQVDGILAGLVSFGIGCGQSGYPGVYTNVAEVLDFIQEITGPL